jgi:hypothetical protein
MVKLVGPVVKPGSGNPMVSAWHGDRVPDADQRGLGHPNLSHHSCPLRRAPDPGGDDELGNVSPTPFPFALSAGLRLGRPGSAAREGADQRS